MSIIIIKKKILRDDISGKIGISPNGSDGRGHQRRPLLSPPWLRAKGALPSPPGTDTQSNWPRPPAQGQEGASRAGGSLNKEEQALLVLVLP